MKLDNLTIKKKNRREYFHISNTTNKKIKIKRLNS